MIRIYDSVPYQIIKEWDQTRRPLLLGFDYPYTVESISALSVFFKAGLEPDVYIDLHIASGQKVSGIVLHSSQRPPFSAAAPIFQSESESDAARFIFDQIAMHSIYST
jgi:hypothetical protein